MYKKYCINLYLRKPSNTVPQWKKKSLHLIQLYLTLKNGTNNGKKTGKQHVRPRPDSVTASFFAPLPKPIPEHFTVLISRDTARNKACQTYSAYNTYWPEAYMDPTDYFLISKANKHHRTNTLSELTTIQERNTNQHYIQ